MDKGTQKILEFILAKNEGQVTDEDKAFLLARRSYVSSQDFERLGINIEEELAKREGAKDPEESGDAQKDPEESGETKKPLSKMTKAELLAEASSRGIAVPEDATNDAIRELLK